MYSILLFLTGQKFRKNRNFTLSIYQHYRETVIEAGEFDSLLLCSDGPYNDISAKTDLNAALTSLLTDIVDNKITNDIEFHKKIASLAEISDDWSILALSLKQSNLFQNKTLYSL